MQLSRMEPKNNRTYLFHLIYHMNITETTIFSFVGSNSFWQGPAFMKLVFLKNKQKNKED